MKLKKEWPNSHSDCMQLAEMFSKISNMSPSWTPSGYDIAEALGIEHPLEKPVRSASCVQNAINILLPHLKPGKFPWQERAILNLIKKTEVGDEEVLREFMEEISHQSFISITSEVVEAYESKLESFRQKELENLLKKENYTLTELVELRDKCDTNFPTLTLVLEKIDEKLEEQIVCGDTGESLSKWAIELMRSHILNHHLKRSFSLIIHKVTEGFLEKPDLKTLGEIFFSIPTTCTEERQKVVKAITIRMIEEINS